MASTCGRFAHLRHLQCAPHQAAAFLKNPRPCLKTLLGINLNTEFRECDYFSLTDEIFFQSIEDAEEFGEGTRYLQISPWRDMLLRGIESHPTITRLHRSDWYPLTSGGGGVRRHCAAN